MVKETVGVSADERTDIPEWAPVAHTLVILEVSIETYPVALVTADNFAVTKMVKETFVVAAHERTDIPVDSDSSQVCDIGS
jgi:hypothetical protein